MDFTGRVSPDFGNKIFNNDNCFLLKICGHTDEEKSCQNVGLDFAFRTIEKEEKQKNCSEERMVNPTGEVMGVPGS